jgi:radical SAM modification target selenobiotic family peptide
MEVDMDKKELKKLLAGLSVASLIAGASLTMAGCATGWSGDNAGAGGTDTEKSEATKEAPAKKPAGKSGWG